MENVSKKGRNTVDKNAHKYFLLKNQISPHQTSQGIVHEKLLLTEVKKKKVFNTVKTATVLVVEFALRG